MKSEDLKVLVVGSGGREHALAWKLSKSKRISQLYAAPGNPGMKQIAKLIPISTKDIPMLAIWTANYAFELSGKILPPEEYCKPIEGITPEMDELEKARRWRQFDSYMDFLSQLNSEVMSAYQLVSSYSLEQYSRELPRVTGGCNYINVPPMREIEVMFKSRDDRFNPVGPNVRKLSQSIIRVMWARQKGIELPEPNRPSHLS